MLKEPTQVALDYICLNLREIDKREIYNVQNHDNPIRLAWECYWALTNLGGRARIAWHNGRPCTFIGFFKHRDGVFEVSMFGTDEFKNCAFECMRWGRDTIIDLVRNHNARRIHCDSAVFHDEAHKMLRAMGAVEEGPPRRNFGKDGSEYQTFCWFIDEPNSHRFAPEDIREKYPEMQEQG